MSNRLQPIKSRSSVWQKLGQIARSLFRINPMTRFTIKRYNHAGISDFGASDPVGDREELELASNIAGVDLSRSLLHQQQQRHGGHDDEELDSHRCSSSNHKYNDIATTRDSFIWYAPLRGGDDANEDSDSIKKIVKSTTYTSNLSIPSSNSNLAHPEKGKSSSFQANLSNDSINCENCTNKPVKSNSFSTKIDASSCSLSAKKGSAPSPSSSGSKLYRRTVNSPSHTMNSTLAKELTVASRSCLLPLGLAASDPPTASSEAVTASPFSYSPVAQRGRTFAARHTRRLVFKDGSCNVTSANVTQKKKKYLVDIFTTCVDMRWRYLLALFAGAFLCSWFFFALAWYTIAISRGDHLSPRQAANGANQFSTTTSLLEPLFDLATVNTPETNQTKMESFADTKRSKRSEPGDNSAKNFSSQLQHLTPTDTSEVDRWDPCVNNVYDFATALLFSIETQHTIGYGYRVIEPTCSAGILLLMVQSCLGVFVQSLMTGLIFAKLSQPKKRAHTIMFSKCAVITKRDGVYCLLFRVGDMRRSHFVATSIRALLVKDRVTKEGECIPLCQFPLDVKTETSAGDAFVFMVWPVVVVHKIDGSSPLWNLSASQLLQEKFEIIVIMEGIVESTGMTTQVRTSYLPGEILWGHCLAPLLTYQKENGQYKIDYAQFHSIVLMADMPECSAKECDSKRNQTGIEETQFDISPYFTVPQKDPTTTTTRVSVMQRVRGSLKLKRSKKDKTAVPSTAPVLPLQITTAPNTNVFFAPLQIALNAPTATQLIAKATSAAIPVSPTSRTAATNSSSATKVAAVEPAPSTCGNSGTPSFPYDPVVTGLESATKLANIFGCELIPPRPRKVSNDSSGNTLGIPVNGTSGSPSSASEDSEDGMKCEVEMKTNVNPSFHGDLKIPLLTETYS